MHENIVKLVRGDKEIYLVKTAHVSKNSVKDVEEAYEEIEPDVICIELDEQRYESIRDPESWRNTDIVKVIREKQVGFLMVNIILSAYQLRMAKSLDSASGDEMREGIRLAKEKNIPLVLADRPIRTSGP